MNTETYKVAKEILDKYGPAEQLKPREPIKVKFKYIFVIIRYSDYYQNLSKFSNSIDI